MNEADVLTCASCEEVPATVIAGNGFPYCADCDPDLPLSLLELAGLVAAILATALAVGWLLAGLMYLFID